MVKGVSDSVDDIDCRFTNGDALPKTELSRRNDGIVERIGTKMWEVCRRDTYIENGSEEETDG